VRHAILVELVLTLASDDRESIYKSAPHNHVRSSHRRVSNTGKGNLSTRRYWSSGLTFSHFSNSKGSSRSGSARGSAAQLVLAPGFNLPRLSAAGLAQGIAARLGWQGVRMARLEDHRKAAMLRKGPGVRLGRIHCAVLHCRTRLSRRTDLDLSVDTRSQHCPR
jgi:hypothetical protein